MFHSAQKFTIHGGNFNNTTYSVSQGKEIKAIASMGLCEIDNCCLDIASRLNPVEIASFQSGRHSSCLEGTRTEILEKLMKWAENPQSAPIFWLSGIAGTGKSTISQSFCERLHKQNLLGASFFCSRESNDLRKVGRIVPTLAYSLAQHFKDYHDQIAIALKCDTTLASQGIKSQLESLLMHPLQNMSINEKAEKRY